MINDELTQKWEFLMQDLSDAKSKRYKYARIYEKIVKYNKKEDLKMLLSIAYKIFKQTDDVKMSKGVKNSELVGEFNVDDFYVNGTIIAVQFIAFCDNLSRLAIEKISQIDKFGHLEIKTSGLVKKIYIKY